MLAALLAGAAPAIGHAAPTSADSARAAELAVQAGTAYRAGDFKTAAELFLQAFQLSERPAQLRNAAKAYEEAGLLDEAAAHWARYRDTTGISADERAEADAHVKLVAEKRKNAEILKAAEAARAAAEEASAAAAAAQRKIEEAEARRAAAPPTVVAQPPAAERSSPLPRYVLIGGGGAAAVTGAILWFVAQGRLDDLDAKLATRNLDGKITGTTPQEVSDEVDGVNTTRVVSGALFSVGIAAAAAGVVWLLLDDDAPSVALGPTPGLDGLTLGGRL